MGTTELLCIYFRPTSLNSIAEALPIFHPGAFALSA